jgi:hypothetical protein
MITRKTVLELLAVCLLYSLIVILIDFVLIFALQRGLDQITESLSFVMLLEGGIGLTVGGAVASYSPLGAKISEVFFHSKPWNAERRKEAEKQAGAWIITGIILVFAALLVSVV